ncbi:hypothetical protein HY642_06670 [Candidatus Woesearchaeota archaeon]|nr:hypothetical protein [Candidatus Woesearchaeota archaeon]
MKRALLFMAVVLLAVHAVIADTPQNDKEKFDIKDPNTWDYSKPEVYAQVDPDDARFDWAKAQYSMVRWAEVNEFAKVELGKIPDAAWNTIDQARITGEKVSDIPAKFFNPAEVLPQYLFHATKDQIASHLGEFENLRDANPQTVTEVFASPEFRASIDIAFAERIWFDPVVNRLFTETTNFDPKQFPKDKYKVVIEGSKVKIIPITEGEFAAELERIYGVDIGAAATVEVQGASIDLQDYGTLALAQLEGQDTQISGLSSGILTLQDGTAVDFQADPAFALTGGRSSITVNANGDIEGYGVTVSDETTSVSGKFRTVGPVVLLQSADGFQSSYTRVYTSIDPETEERTEKRFVVNTVGDAVVVAPTGAPLSQEFQLLSKVIYGDDLLRVRGRAEVIRGDTRILSKSIDAIVNIVGHDTDARGKVFIKSPAIAYEGLKDTSFLRIESRGYADIVIVDATEDGDIARLAKPYTVGDLSGDRFLSKEDQVNSIITRKDGRLSAALDTDSLQVLAGIDKDPTKYALMHRNTVVSLQGTGVLSFDVQHGIDYVENQGMSNERIVNILSPAAAGMYLGEEQTGEMLARAVLAARDKYTARGYAEGDHVRVTQRNRVTDATIVSVNADGILVKTSSGRLERLQGDGIIVGGVAPEELTRRLDVFKTKPQEAARLMETYEHKYRGTERGALANLHGFYLSREFNLPYTTNAQDIIALQTPDGTPLYYRTEFQYGKEVVAQWSPDKENWMSLNELTVKGGVWQGRQPTETNQEIIKALSRAGGSLATLQREVQQHPDYDMTRGALLETRKYDEWYNNFASTYGNLGPEFTQRAAMQAAEAFMREGNVDGAARFYSIAAKVDSGSDFGKSASQNMELMDSERAIDGARMFATQRYSQELNRARPRSVLETDEFYKSLMDKGILTRTMAGLSSVAPFNLVRDLQRGGELDDAQRSLQVSAEALKAAEDLVRQRKVADIDEALKVMRAAIGPSAFGTAPVSTAYEFGRRDFAKELQEGEETGVIGMERPIPNDGNQYYNTGGDPILYKQFRMKDGRVEVRFGDGDISTDYSEWMDLEKFNRAAFNDLPPAVVQKAQMLSAQGSFRGLNQDHYQYLSTEPAIHAGIALRSAPEDEPTRETKLLELAQQYRDRNNFEAAAIIARKLSQQSQNEQTRAKAYDLYNEIVDPKNEWLNFADESLHEETVLDVAADVTNPFAFALFGAAGRGIAAAAPKVPGGVTVLTTTGKALTLPSKVLLGSKGPAWLKGTINVATDLAIAQQAGERLGPEAGVFVGFMTGTVRGAAAQVQGRLANQAAIDATRRAFQNAKLAPSPYIRAAEGKFTTVVEVEGTPDFSQLKGYGKVESRGPVTKYTNSAGEETWFVAKGTDEATIRNALGAEAGDLVSASEIQARFTAKASLEAASKAVGDLSLSAARAQHAEAQAAATGAAPAVQKAVGKPVKLIGTQEALKQAEEAVAQTRYASKFNDRRLDALDAETRQKRTGPVTAVILETNGYTIDGQLVRASTGKVMNELSHANLQGHETFGDKVMEHSFRQYEGIGRQVVERYNKGLSSGKQISQVEGYTRAGTRGAGLFFTGTVDKQRLATVLKQVLDEGAPTFLNGLSSDVRAAAPGQVTGFKATIGTGNTATQAYTQAGHAFGSGTLKDGTFFGGKGTTTVVSPADIDFSKTLLLDRTAAGPGIDTPDPQTGRTLREEYQTARTNYLKTGTTAERQNLEDIVNRINRVAHTNPVTGAPSHDRARLLAKQPGARPLSAGGEEGLIVNGNQEIFSDVDSLGDWNKADKQRLAALMNRRASFGQSIDDIVKDVEIGKEVDAILREQHVATQKILDRIRAARGPGAVLNVEDINRIRQEVAKTGASRSYAVYNSHDGVIPAGPDNIPVRVDKNVRALVEKGEYNVASVEKPVSVDKFNEMVTNFVKERGKNGVAVLESLADDGTKGTVLFYNDNLPVPERFDVDVKVEAAALSQSRPLRLNPAEWSGFQSTLEDVVSDFHRANPEIPIGYDPAKMRVVGSSHTGSSSSTGKRFERAIGRDYDVNMVMPPQEFDNLKVRIRQELQERLRTAKPNALPLAQKELQLFDEGVAQGYIRQRSLNVIDKNRGNSRIGVKLQKYGQTLGVDKVELVIVKKGTNTEHPGVLFTER